MQFIRTFLLFLLLVIIPGYAFSWGFWAHRRINRVAVFTLPREMLGFYKKNIEFLTAHATDADKRRFVSKDEAPRHFIDLDRYGKFPYDTLPHKWKEALERFTIDTLKANGILPWQIGFTYHKLVEAFRNHDSLHILRYSADLGHYAGDACVPLHSTQNYNGQMTGQEGIHALWESRIPELLGEEYNYFVGKADYMDSSRNTIWNILLSSNSEVDSVLSFEKKVSLQIPEDKKYALVPKLGRTEKDYSAEYVKTYSDFLNGQVERRMRTAILLVGSLWMSAWIDAGQPDLSRLSTPAALEDEKLPEAG